MFRAQTICPSSSIMLVRGCFASTVRARVALGCGPWQRGNRLPNIAYPSWLDHVRARPPSSIQPHYILVELCVLKFIPLLIARCWYMKYLSTHVCHRSWHTFADLLASWVLPKREGCVFLHMCAFMDINPMYMYLCKSFCANWLQGASALPIVLGCERFGNCALVECFSEYLWSGAQKD